MAQLIPMEEMGDLRPASALKPIADEALYLLEKKRVASVLNNAANTGEHLVSYANELSDKMKEELESLGYIVTPGPRAADKTKFWTISGF